MNINLSILYKCVLKHNAKVGHIGKGIWNDNLIYSIFLNGYFGAIFLYGNKPIFT